MSGRHATLAIYIFVRQDTRLFLLTLTQHSFLIIVGTRNWIGESTTMPFGLVSAWNKRRRSKSQDHTDPCTYVLHVSISLSFFEQWNIKSDQHVPGTYKPIGLWQLEDQARRSVKRALYGSSVFTLREMEEATCSFSEENFLGKGGFGRVYRGILRSSEVKCLEHTYI